MILVSAVEPTTKDACCHRVEKSVLQLSCHNMLVTVFQNKEGCLAKILVSDGNFARHDVG